MQQCVVDHGLWQDEKQVWISVRAISTVCKLIGSVMSSATYRKYDVQRKLTLLCCVGQGGNRMRRQLEAMH